MAGAPRVIERQACDFELHVPVVIVGAGGCGMVAALAARDLGVEVLMIERGPRAWGTTSMSTGLIPAAGTPEQNAAGIQDDPALFASDIQTKARHQANQAIVDCLTAASAGTVGWLQQRHGIPLTLVDGFVYPGHSVRRMFGTPNRTGGELMAALEAAAIAAGADLLTDALVTTLCTDGTDRITGIEAERPDGERVSVGCDALILACCGFGGNPEMVARYIPEIAGAVLHGHPGNKGDAIAWGEMMDAALSDLDAYQGHGGLAAGHAIPMLWPLIMTGGFQVNIAGKRFSDESKGYSEQAVKVVAQPGNIAWSVFDQTRYDMMLQFDDFQQAVTAGAVVRGDSVAELAARCKLPGDTLAATMEAIDDVRNGHGEDPFGRRFSTDHPPLKAPFYATKVNGALFHTQGGLEIDTNGRVLHPDGRIFPNLFAGGGAARGISGRGASGYIAGNGLLTATGLGRIAGTVAARDIITSQT